MKDKFGGIADDIFAGKEVKKSGVPVAAKGETAKAEEAKEGKTEKKVLTPREKVIQKLIKRSGAVGIPTLKDMLHGKTGHKVRIKDVAVFVGKPKEMLLQEMVEQCPIINRINMSAEVSLRRMIQVGIQILRVGRILMPVHVARIKEDGRMEVASGRHRVALLALLYGPDAEIPVLIEEMSLNEARETAVVANQSRRVQPLEKAEHAVMRAVAGNAEADIDEMYIKTSTNKDGIKKYCTFVIFDKSHPARLTFKVARESIRNEGEMATIPGVENFFGNALPWKRGMPRKDLDAALRAAIKFLNEFCEKVTAIPGFKAIHHMASMPLTAVGRYYRNYEDVGGKNAIEIVDDIAKAVVEMGDCGRRASMDIYESLTKALQPKK